MKKVKHWTACYTVIPILIRFMSISTMPLPSQRWSCTCQYNAPTFSAMEFHLFEDPATMVKRLQLYCSSSEMMDLVTWTAGGKVRANVGYSSLSDTLWSAHFCNETRDMFGQIMEEKNMWTLGATLVWYGIVHTFLQLDKRYDCSVNGGKAHLNIGCSSLTNTLWSAHFWNETRDMIG